MMEKKQLNIFKVRDLRKKDQFKIDDLYLNGYARVCKPIATAVYNSLCRHAGFHNQKAFPSQSLIAYQHDISIATVKRALKKLAEYNIILIEQEKINGKFKNNVYTLLDKSEWKKIDTVAHQRPTAYRSSNTVAHLTTTVKWPTKDNKVLRITNIKDNKEREELTPSQVMNLFLKEERYFNKVCKCLIEEKRLSKDLVLKELANFRGYWSELNGSGKKQRWQMEKTFELNRRLLTWFRNVDKFKGQFKKSTNIGVAIPGYENV